MASRRPAFTMDDLLPKAALELRPIQASTNTSNLLSFNKVSFSGPSLTTRLETAINRANRRIAVDLKQALDAAMRSSNWPTPTTPSADIYETGELLESGTVRVTPNGVHISYDAPYAALVHYGGYINPYGSQSTRIYLPARPWVDSVLRGGAGIPAFDFGRYYAEEIAKAFN